MRTSSGMFLSIAQVSDFFSNLLSTVLFPFIWNFSVYLSEMLYIEFEILLPSFIYILILVGLFYLYSIAIVFHFRCLLGAICFSLKDKIVSNIESRIAAWTFLPIGNYDRRPTYLNAYMENCSILSFIDQCYCLICSIIREWGGNADTALWSWSKVWSTLRFF